MADELLPDPQELRKEFPHLFAAVESPGHRAEFEIMPRAPDDSLVGNAYIVPRIGDQWLYVVSDEGRLQVPGGKKEPGERLLDIVSRELMEEAGCRVLSFSVIGAWRTLLKGEHLRRPHLPFPVMYMVVGSGHVEMVGQPTNPVGAGATAEVRLGSLSTVVDDMRRHGRRDYADLYLLCAQLARG